MKFRKGQRVLCVDGFTDPKDFPLAGKVYTIVGQTRGGEFVGLAEAPRPEKCEWFASRFVPYTPLPVCPADRSRVDAGPKWGA